MTQITPSLRTVRDHASAVTYFVARRAELVEAAEVSTDLAGVVLAAGDTAAAADLMADVRVMLAEIAKIDGLKR